MSNGNKVWRARVTFVTPEPLTEAQREALAYAFGDRPDNFTTIVGNAETRKVEVEFDLKAESKQEAILSAGTVFSAGAHEVLSEFRDVQIDAEQWEEVERMTENGTDA